MSLTAYHAKLFAHELTKRSSSDNVDKLASALSDAQVDLNPHQVEAALFAFRSPLSKGAILADEVGLRQNHRSGHLASPAVGGTKPEVACYMPGQPTQAVEPGTARQVLSCRQRSLKPKPSTRLSEAAISILSTSRRSFSARINSPDPKSLISVRRLGT